LFPESVCTSYADLNYYRTKKGEAFHEGVYKRRMNEKKLDIAVIILTYNEEKNLPHALSSVVRWADEIFVLDSFSKDRTVEIARHYGCQVFQHHFENYAKQRNYALKQFPVKSEWIFFLDADEWLPDELKKEISAVIASNPVEDGFYIKRKLIWMGRWIRRGYYPTWILRLFRKGKARCEERSVNEHLLVDGKVGYLKNDFIHEDRKGITDWIDKHNRYATHEALELIKWNQAVQQKEIEVRFWGTQAERKRWLRYRVWNKMPPLIRPFFYFFYRYILRGGFLDGWQGFIYHFLQALWFPLLIDIKYIEMKTYHKSTK
jgi:glycosyltransferase involved in cell wall biosynthesis